MVDSEVITLGETMLRLTPPQFQRLEQAAEFEVHVGGSESNTAVGLARLGRKVIWISRLPASPLGRLVSETIGRFSVNVDYVVWSQSDRLVPIILSEANHRARRKCFMTVAIQR